MTPLRFMPPDLRVQRKGRNNWMAQCPFHNDRTPSMSITQGDDGRYRWKCHGCDEGGDTITFIQKSRNMSFVEAVKLAIVAAKNGPPTPEIEHVYDYLDADGSLLYQVVRYTPKGFKVRTLLPNGEYCWRRPPKTVLYCADVLAHARANPGKLEAAGEVVYLVEGEKDALALHSLGAFATTWPFGATAWRDEYAASLRGLPVVVVPDRDEPGMAAGRRAYEAIKPWASKIGHVLLSTGKDVSDYLATGKTLDDLKKETEWS